MASKLDIWNHALRLAGQQALASLTSDLPTRPVLDEAFPRVAEDCLSRSPWNFAIKIASLSNPQNLDPVPVPADSDVEGLDYRYGKPNDWLFTNYLYARPLAEDGTQRQLAYYRDLGGNIHVQNIDPNTEGVFIEYVSNTFLTDENINTWTPQFAQYVAYALAVDIIPSLTQNLELAKQLKDESEERRLIALQRNEQDDPQARRPGEETLSDVLAYYNQSLRLIGVKQLQSISDNVQARYVLDQAWARVVRKALTDGIWNFNLKSVQLDALDPTTAPAVPGYEVVFRKPTDWLYTNTVGENAGTYNSDQDFEYRELNDFVYINGVSSTIFMEYASTDAIDNISLWSASFAEYVSYALAYEVQMTLAPDMSTGKRDMLREDVRRKLSEARTRDARDERRAIIKPGRLISAMRGYGNIARRGRETLQGSPGIRLGDGCV